jgi:mono/diheme cytochrome c family protein
MNPLRTARTCRRLVGVAGLAAWWIVSGDVPRAEAASGDAASGGAMRLLKAECFSCHNQERKKGGLVLTSRERLLEGGDNGVVAVPGKPDGSLLAKAVLKDADPHMPPKKQLTDAQIKVIRNWIKGGLAWNQAALDEEEAITPVRLAALPPSYQPVLALALSPDGGKLAVGRGGSVVIHDASQTNFPVATEFEAHQDAVQSLAWSGDGRWLASGGFRRLALWNGESFKPEREWTNGLSGRVTAVRFALDGGQLLLADSVAGQGGFLRLFNLADGKVVASWRAHEDTIFDLDLSRDGKQLVTAGGDRLIKVWDIASRKELARLEGHTAQVLAVAFNTNAMQVVSGGADKQLKVWDVETHHATSSLGKHAAAITAVAWPGEGKVIVASTDAGVLFTYKNLKAHTGRESSESGDERKLGEAGDTVQCIAVGSDAKQTFVGTHDGVVQAWSSEGKLLAKLERPTNAPTLTIASRPGDLGSRREEVLLKRETRSAEGGIENIRASSRRLLQGEKVVSLAAEPKEIHLSSDAPRHGLLVTAQTADGFAVDVTAETKLTSSRSAPFEITGSGEVLAKGPGEGTVIARLDGKRVEIPVRVHGADGAISSTKMAPPPVSFLRDVLPALSKAGCNAGPCHAKPEGQNGFKLSVFSYDPKSDYSEIVKEYRGRRIFPAAPDESLLIRKPTTSMPHEGGLRFERGSDTHQMLVRWMREGMAYSLTNEPALDRIVAFPKERRYRKGATQRLLVQAHYSDGSIRDVTRLAGFDSNDKEIAAVDAHGRITVGILNGQGVVVARYMGLVADSQILVPADHLLPESQYASLPKNNFIDELAYAHFQQLGLFPSELCTDAEFLRRAKLDAIGLLPTADEVRAFLGLSSSQSEEALTNSERGTRSAGRRRALIDRILDDPAYADYWANKWSDLLRPNPDRVGVKSVFVFDQWLRESFRQNKPFDQFVRDILLAEGSNHRDGPAVVYRDRREPTDLTTMFSQLFLGTRLECAKCHHHPNEKWSQDDFYQFAAFFGPVKQKGAGLSPPISGGTETFYFAPGGKGVKHPVTGAVMPPRVLDGPLPQVSTNTDPRLELVRWLTTPDNPFFARAAVNRVWAVFFGRGLVEPVDDFRISNPCVNPPLLDALAEDFAKHGYDLKHLMRTIMESRLYQLSSTPNESNLADTRNFSRAYRRRLPAEVLFDAVNDVTGVPDTFAAMPVGSRATQAWSYKIESPLMDAFNRPNPSSDPPCERDRQMSVVQSLHLMNSKALQAKLSHKTGRARQLADSTKSPEEIVTELYLVTFSRPPSDEELKMAAAVFSATGATRQTATEDVFWSLLNSAEFVFNH